jgi:hypothetical protein
MEEIKAAKKERKFLKAIGDVALTLVRELILNVGKKLINKSGNKRQGLILAFIIIASTFAIAQYPTTTNKQRLGFQTSGDGLVFRGRASDTTVLKPSTINNAYHLFDTLNNVLFSYIKTKGGWKFNNSDTVIIQGVTMPFDSITFNTAKDGTVGVGEVEYNDTQGSLIQGLKGGNVTNVIGQQLHQRVNNRTGATLNKGDVVFLSGSQGNRITVAKAIATSDPTSANTFGIVAEQILNNASGYIITEGLITNINTSALTQDSAVYLSGTTAGALTSTKPQAPIHGVYIGVCVKTNAGSGEIFVKIRNGQELDELHDVRISNPTNNASLYFKSSEGLWRDTTASLLVSDTASMLTNYLRSGVAAGTYLPLTGGTLTGGLNGTTGTFNTRLGVGSFTGSPLLFASGTGNQEVHFAHSQNTAGATVTLRLTNTNASFFDQGAYFQGIVNRGINEMSGALGANGSEYIRLRGVDDGGVVGVGIFNTNPSYNLDVTGTFRATGASLIGGTLGVTGATTLSNLASASTSIVTASTTGLLSSISTLPIANGGTGATTAATARTALGVPNSATTISTSSPLSGGGDLSANRTIAISQSSGSVNGFLSSTDWTTFNNKQNAITLTTTGTSGAATLTGATLNIPQYSGGSGTVTNITVTSPLTITNPTTTPLIQINAANGTTSSGVVTTGTQQFGGAKTFNDNLRTNGNMTVDGNLNVGLNATISAMATTSTLTHVLGVNSSNTIGEIGVGDGIKFTGGSLGLDLYKVIALLDVPITGPQTSSDTPFTVTGAALGQPVILGVPNVASSANTNYTAWVSAANTVTIRFNNYSSSSVNPPSGSFTIVVLNL